METRRTSDGRIRRRRRCPACHNDFETVEQINAEVPHVVKFNGTREPFDKEKVRKGIVKSAVRQYHVDWLSELVESISSEVRRSSSDGLIDSTAVAEIVLTHLQGFDPVTHVRFALTQLGRRDHGDTRGWRNEREFRHWLEENYPYEVGRARPSAKIAQVIKRDGRREPFARHKLERSIGICSKGRGSSTSVRDLATEITRDVELELSEQSVVTSGQLAAETIRVLRTRDPIAAIRFASTAKQFVSVEDYEAEALGLRNRSRS
ncbi:ATP cone domain-containing protein [Ferrimicrobium sp.]|jgi:transcriptional repressor NrdR|uniref:ATP cone domain-containing protein n=2 Tax=Ferrimicrobium TaxID=121038 RepID=UPI00262C1707|nr:ATP cone domain-containing protein [Ferrimicrobium sp.]